MRREEISTPRLAVGARVVRRSPSIDDLPARHERRFGTETPSSAGLSDNVARAYEVLPMDTAVWRTWAKLMHRKSDTLADDARIAATAFVHGLTVVTRNVRDFRPFNVPTF